MVLEFGVWKGHSLRMLAEYFEDETIYGFDSFWGLPEDWATLSTGDLSLGGKVPSGLPVNTELVVGKIEETLPEFLIEHQDTIDFCHIDVDVYSTTKFILSNIKDRLVNGSIVVFDEYRNYESYEIYEYRAFKEFREENPEFDFREVILEKPEIHTCKNQQATFVVMGVLNAA